MSESKEKTDVDTEHPAVTNSPPEKMKIDNSGYASKSCNCLIS